MSGTQANKKIWDAKYNNFQHNKYYLKKRFMHIVFQINRISKRECPIHAYSYKNETKSTPVNNWFMALLAETLRVWVQQVEAFLAFHPFAQYISLHKPDIKHQLFKSSTEFNMKLVISNKKFKPYFCNPPGMILPIQINLK